MTEIFAAAQSLPVPAEEAFAWHGRPGAFQRLVPGWRTMDVLDDAMPLVDGAVHHLRLRVGPIRLRWNARIEGVQRGRQFRDVQERGPFAEWVHTHRFVPDGAGCRLEDEVTYRLRYGAPGRLLGGRRMRREVARLFRFRHARTLADLTRHAAYREQGPLRIAISGASGFVGTALGAFLTSGGHTVLPLVRRAARHEGEIAWNPATGEIDGARLEGVDAVVHLAGAGIADRRWSGKRKAEIMNSRVKGTELLARTLAGLQRKPRVLVSMSAVGFYGARGDEPLTEASPAGEGFLAEVTQAWEAATVPAAAADIRVVHPRLGVVLGAGGGALARLLPLFRLGLGGPLGSGRQVMSWVALDDVVGALHHMLFTPALVGPVNVTAPHPVSNREFARVLGGVLHRPALLPLPAAAVRLAFGQLGEEALLGGQRVLPQQLLGSGFAFRRPELGGALRTELGLYEGPG